MYLRNQDLGFSDPLPLITSKKCHFLDLYDYVDIRMFSYVIFHLFAFLISSCGTIIFRSSFFRETTGAWPLRLEKSVFPPDPVSLNFMATTSFFVILPLGATLK